MATPMTADQFLAALKAEGCKVSEHAGWRTHNRAGHGDWGPMNGVMIHHTAGNAPGDGGVVWSGRSDLPGPLAHGYLAKDGVVTMTANGRANHAGGGSPAVLAAVVAEAALPATHFHDGASGATDGNSHFYGLEISNLGTSGDPYPAAQYEAAVRWATAICRHHGWSAKSVIGHSEWSDWKNDPSFPMTTFRADVAARLAAGPGAPQEDDMPVTAAEMDQIATKTADRVIDPTHRNQIASAVLYWLRPVLDPTVALPTDPSAAGIVGGVQALRAILAKQPTGGASLTDAQVAALGDRLAANPTFAANLAEQVAEKIATRLQS